MDSPIVTILMSVFNGQAFLSEAVESILAQTFRDFEFLVVDDGSTDRTPEILADYASRDERMRVLRHENKGRALSLNIGMNLAIGNYIARMDADDVAMPRRLEEQVDFMERHPEVGILGGAVELMTAAGRVIHTTRPPLEDSEIRSLMLRCNPICHPAVMMRKDVALISSGYRKVFLDADDYDLWLRMSERSQLACLASPVLRYRIHSDQVSVRNLRHQTLCMLAARAAASLRQRGKPDPLWNVEEITPELLDTLGVKAAEIRQDLLDNYDYWMRVLGRNQPDAVLRMIEELLQWAPAESFDRSTVANAWLMAAGIHYRQGRHGKAMLSAGRAVLVRPIVAGRPVKRAFTRLSAAINGCLGATRT